MEARKEAQSRAWEAILRIAGGDVDFDRDDLVALEKRAQAEFDRARVTRAAEKAREEKEDRARVTRAAKRAREEKQEIEQRVVEFHENVRRHAFRW